MLQISVTTDIKEASRYLKKVGERNIPLAVAQALTGTAKHLAKVQAHSTALYFDRPTKFTQRAFGVRMAKAVDYKRGTMFSRVFAKDIQARYLKFGVEGRRARHRLHHSLQPVRVSTLGCYLRRDSAQKFDIAFATFFKNFSLRARSGLCRL